MRTRSVQTIEALYAVPRCKNINNKVFPEVKIEDLPLPEKIYYNNCCKEQKQGCNKYDLQEDEQDGYGEMWPVFRNPTHLMRLLGVMPWSVSNKIMVARFLSFPVLYSFVTILFQTLYYYVLHLEVSDEVRSKRGQKPLKTIEYTILNTIISLQLMTSIVYAVLGFRSIQYFVSIMKYLGNIIQMHAEEERQSIMKCLVSCTRIRFVLIICGNCVISFLAFCQHYENWVMSGYTEGILFVVNIVCDVGTFLIIGDLCFCLIINTIIVVVEHGLESLKCYLENMLDDRQEFPYSYSKQIEADVPRWVRMYSNIRLTVDTLNPAYGGILLCQIIVCFMEILGLAYQSIFNLSVVPFGAYTLTMLWSFVYMLIVCNKGTTLCNKSEALVGPIHRILEERTLTREVRDQLHLLMSQICNKRLQITAGDFCVMERHLIIAILNVVATYLIVLVQFKTSVAEE